MLIATIRLMRPRNNFKAVRLRGFFHIILMSVYLGPLSNCFLCNTTPMRVFFFRDYGEVLRKHILHRRNRSGTVGRTPGAVIRVLPVRQIRRVPDNIHRANLYHTKRTLLVIINTFGARLVRCHYIVCDRCVSPGPRYGRNFRSRSPRPQQ